MCVYGIKHDPMVHGMYRQNATTNPRGKEKQRKRPRKRCINNATETDQREKEKLSNERDIWIVIKIIMSRSFITGQALLKPVAAFPVRADAHFVRASLTQP